LAAIDRDFGEVYATYTPIRNSEAGNGIVNGHLNLQRCKLGVT